MDSAQTKSSVRQQDRRLMRWRPKFSVWALLVAVTLLCCYVACWAPTQRRGLTDVENHVNWSGRSPRGQARVYGVNTSSSFPLVVGTDVHSEGRNFRGYYLWLFGVVQKLPLERAIPDDAEHWGYVMRVGQTTKSEVQLRFGTPDVKSDLEWTYDDWGTFRFDERGRITELAD